MTLREELLEELAAKCRHLQAVVWAQGAAIGLLLAAMVLLALRG